MVTQWLHQQGSEKLHTFSSRGWPRPAGDPHGNETPYSDPVYAVWGFKPEINNPLIPIRSLENHLLWIHSAVPYRRSKGKFELDFFCTMFKDPILLLLVGILALSLSGFLVGLLPYPFGLLVLLALIIARLLYLS